MYFGLSSFPLRLLNSLPQHNRYAQPMTSPYYVMRLPVPPPPNAVQYPRITLSAADWSPKVQCFTGECKLVAKITGSSLPDFNCSAMFTITYVPVEEWFATSESSCQAPVLIHTGDAFDVDVIWDATGDRPVVEATGPMENHSRIVKAHGPCELLVTPVEGSRQDTYVCSAFYTLRCESLENWKKVHQDSENLHDLDVDQETSAAASEDPDKTGSQNDVKPIPAYESPKTEKEYFEQFPPLPTKYFTQPHSKEQKESAPVEKSSTFHVRHYAAKNNSEMVDGRVHNSSAFVKKQHNAAKPITELSLGDSKTCTLLQNNATKQSSRGDDQITKSSLGNSIPLKTLTSVRKESETTDSNSTLYKSDNLSHAQVKVTKGLKSSAPAVNAQTVTKTTTQSCQNTPKDLEKQEIPASSIVTESPKGKEKVITNLKKSRFDDLKTELPSIQWLLRRDRVPVLMPSDDESSDSEYESSDEEEDDEVQDTETDSTKKDKINEFLGIGVPGSSAQMDSSDEDEGSEWESDEEEKDNSSWEIVER